MLAQAVWAQRKANAAAAYRQYLPVRESGESSSLFQLYRTFTYGVPSAPGPARVTARPSLLLLPFVVHCSCLLATSQDEGAAQLAGSHA